MCAMEEKLAGPPSYVGWLTCHFSHSSAASARAAGWRRILRACGIRSGRRDQIDFWQEHVGWNRQDHALPRQIFIPALHIACFDAGHVTAQSRQLSCTGMLQA
jgi:hypothetical protein